MAFKADASDLRNLGKALRQSKPEVYRQVRRAALAEARIIRDDAKRRASWSKRIPDTIRAGTLGGLGAIVRAGNQTTAPHAKPYEHAGAEGVFRHPVFPDAALPRSEWEWIDQLARPFLHPAAMERFPETVKALGTSVQIAVDNAKRRK